MAPISDSSSTAATASESSSGIGHSSSSDSGFPSGWPELWYGQYYNLDPSVPLGTPTFSDGFLNVAFNLDFSEERVVIEYFAFDGEPSGTTILTPRFEGGLVELAPPPGMDHIDLPPGESAKASATLRPGPVEDDCASMALDIQLDASGPGPDVLALAVHRGRICLLDPIDAADGVCGGEPTRPCDELPECCVLIDACAGDEAPTTCE